MSIEIIHESKNLPNIADNKIIHRTNIMTLYKESDSSFICSFICPFKEDLSFVRIVANETQLLERRNHPMGYTKNEFGRFSNNVLKLCDSINDIFDKNIPLDFYMEPEYLTMPFLANNLIIYFKKKKLFKKELFENSIDDILYSLTQIFYISFYAVASKCNIKKMIPALNTDINI